MRPILWTALVLVPAAATAGPSCAVPPAETAPAIPASAVQQAPPPAESLSALAQDAITRSPALERIASQGAELLDLGEAHGLRTIFARKGTAFQLFYLTGDGEAVVGGVMWDASGHDITRQQVSAIPGAIPTVSIGTSSVAPSPEPLSGPKLLQIMATTRYGTEGDPKAPRLWMFIDPYCAFSIRAEEQLQPYVASGRLELAIVPISVLDYEDQGRSTLAAQVMASLPADHMVAAWTGQELGGPPPADGAAKLQLNDVAKDAIALKGTPTFLWQRADGTVGRADGIPADLDALIASIRH